MDILRFITAGSVDDGKSTLIGRLLYDTNNIKADVLMTVSAGETSEINLAHVTDGLRAERLQGITIDIAYKYFSTANRKYIISDAPGHFQYTKNMVTGASMVDVIIILIDACNGITEQTRIHSLVASFLNIKNVVVAINKMDMVGYDEQHFLSIKNKYIESTKKLKFANLSFIPVAALHGDNISSSSENMLWYTGETLFNFLENCPVNNNECNNSCPARFSVQYVTDHAQDTLYAGKLLSGKVKTGDTVIVSPGHKNAVIRKVIHGYEDVTAAVAGQNISLLLDYPSDIKRGDVLSDVYNIPACGSHFEATICWLDDVSMQIGKEYLLRINSTEMVCRITSILYGIDSVTFNEYPECKTISVNQFAKVRIDCDDVITYDSFANIPANGRGVLIDPGTNNTSAAFVIG